MEDEKITIRPACAADAEFIARGFLTAMWIPDEQQRVMLPLCKGIAEMDDTLYSWRNTRIAQYEGRDAGVLISYNGASYERAALKTFTIVRDGGGDDFTQMTAEAEAGEWYIDTLAVVPEYRRRGIAKALLRDGIAQGMADDTIRRVTLYVDPDHPWVVNLYRSVGFQPAGEAVIFNQTFKKMAVERKE